MDFFFGCFFTSNDIFSSRSLEYLFSFNHYPNHGNQVLLCLNPYLYIESIIFLYLRSKLYVVAYVCFTAAANHICVLNFIENVPTAVIEDVVRIFDPILCFKYRLLNVCVFNHSKISHLVLFINSILSFLLNILIIAKKRFCHIMLFTLNIAIYLIYSSTVCSVWHNDLGQ